jgi:hypothetical protein
VKRLLERLTRNLVRRGVREGLLGGNGIWLAAGAVAWLVRWLSRSPTQRVVREQIRVGETITVRSVPPPPFGRKARKLAKADRAAAKLARHQVRSERKAAAELVDPARVADDETPARGTGGGGSPGRKGAGRSARAPA